MPRITQVRYFNEADRAAADRAAAVIKQTYRDVQVVRIGCLPRRGSLRFGCLAGRASRGRIFRTERRTAADIPSGQRR